jgi:hypothetical protein
MIPEDNEPTAGQQGFVMELRTKGQEFLAVFDGIWRAPKLQSSKAPSSKLQRSSKSQAPKQGPSDLVAIQGGALKYLCLELLWSLEFGILKERLCRTLISPRACVVRESAKGVLLCVRGSKAPRNDAFRLSGIIRFDQGSSLALQHNYDESKLLCH